MAYTLANFPATVCNLLQIDLPELATPQPFSPVVSSAQSILGSRPLERLLVYAPDAIGQHLWERFPQAQDEVLQHAPVPVELNAMLPSNTPVCFASLFTGAQPAQHGIQRYEKRRLTCDTLFDALVRAGKRVALVALEDSSMGTIFGGRGPEYRIKPSQHVSAEEAGDPMVYFIEQYDAQANWRGLKLLAEDAYDVLVVYNMQYDDLLHATEPFSREGTLAFQLHLASFARLAQAAGEYWKHHDYALCFTPDHGAHLDPETGHGTHGSDLTADVALKHFWGFSPAGR